MLAIILRVAALTGVYLLALTSLQPGDVIVGLALAIILVAVGTRQRGRAAPMDPAVRPDTSVAARMMGVPALVGGTLVDMVRGSATVVRYCLGASPSAAGLVTVPIGRCRPAVAAAWGIRVGIAPDSIVVELDEERGEMLVHVLDASRPEDVAAAQQDVYRRRQHRVFG
jgi:multisubunit Na+/H+ antiporter MnhE subunit